MPEPEDDLMELQEEIKPITPEEAEKNPGLRADPTKAKEGVLDGDPAKFEALELEAAEDVVMAGEGGGPAGLQAAALQAAGAGAAGSSISDHQRKALALAVSLKGIRETPPGSNCNPYSRYFGFRCQYWCADFVAFCLDRTADRDRKVLWGYPSAVSNITAWGQRHGLIHRWPQKGDIFTRRDGAHTGFVLSAQGSGFMTIEGNTYPPPGASHGDVWVASHPRDASSGLYYFVRFHF